MAEVRLQNFLLWDDLQQPARVPLITLTPDEFFKTNKSEGEGWIIIGKWKIKITVEPNEKDGVLRGFTITSPDKKTTVKADGEHGSIFIDQTLMDVKTRDDQAVKGHFQG